MPKLQKIDLVCQTCSIQEDLSLCLAPTIKAQQFVDAIIVVVLHDDTLCEALGG